MGLQLVRRALGDDPALVHDGEVAGELIRLLQVVYLRITASAFSK